MASTPRFPDSARLVIERVDYSPGADGRASVEVRLTHAGQAWVGRGQGLATREGELRMGAEATLAAVRASTSGRFAPVLGGIKAIRAFDAWLVIVSVEADVEEGHLRLLGAEAAVGGDLVQGAVRSILDALNRILERYLR